MQERRAFVYDASTIVTSIGGSLAGLRLAPRRLFQFGWRSSSWDVAVTVRQTKVFMKSLMPQLPLDAAVNSRGLAGPSLAIDSFSYNPSGSN